MSTRGFLTFVVDGQEKTTYNHSDSYPGGLGIGVLSFARGDMQTAREQARALQVIDEATRPTDEQKERLRDFADLHVSTKSMDDWYCLLRRTQGDPALILAAGYMSDAHEFPTDSLFAEYGYVVDFDANRLEAYVGFQHDAHDKGRFADRPGSEPGYHPVALAASWPLADLPSDDEFVKAIDGDEA